MGQTIAVVGKMSLSRFFIFYFQQNEIKGSDLESFKIPPKNNFSRGNSCRVVVSMSVPQTMEVAIRSVRKSHEQFIKEYENVKAYISDGSN